MTETIFNRSEQNERHNSILGGQFEKPADARPDLELIANEVWQSVHNYAETARPRILALESLATSAKLLGIDLSADAEDTDHALAQDLSAISTRLGKDWNIYKIKPLADDMARNYESDILHDPAILAATHYLIELTPDTDENKGVAKDIARAMVGHRAGLEKGL